MSSMNPPPVLRRRTMKKGDTKPALQVQILNPDGTPRNITDDIVKFKMGIPGQVRKIDNGDVFVVSAATGVVEYRWQIADTNTAPAEYRAVFVLNGTDTFPKKGYIVVEIEDTV